MDIQQHSSVDLQFCHESAVLSGVCKELVHPGLRAAAVQWCDSILHRQPRHLRPRRVFLPLSVCQQLPRCSAHTQQYRRDHISVEAQFCRFSGAVIQCWIFYSAAHLPAAVQYNTTLSVLPYLLLNKHYFWCTDSGLQLGEWNKLLLCQWLCRLLHCGDLDGAADLAALAANSHLWAAHDHAAQHHGPIWWPQRSIYLCASDWLKHSHPYTHTAWNPSEPLSSGLFVWRCLWVRLPIHTILLSISALPECSDCCLWDTVRHIPFHLWDYASAKIGKIIILRWFWVHVLKDEDVQLFCGHCGYFAK